jgi:hypothetical protein
MMCPTCGCDPCASPPFCRTCRAGDRRKARDERPQYIDRWFRAAEQIPHDWDLMGHNDLHGHFMHKRREMIGAPRATIEAVMFGLRERGVAALAGRNFQDRLAELKPDQVRECIVRLDRLRPKYPAITDRLLLLLGELIR